MSHFQGNLFNTRKEYHSYVVEGSGSKALEALGISVYTKSSLNNFFKNNVDVSSILTTKPDDMLGGGTSFTSAELLWFDPENKKYKLQTGQDILRTTGNTQVGNSISEFLDKVDAFYLNKQNNDDVKEIIHKIQNSYSGCITFPIVISAFDTAGTGTCKVFVNGPQYSEDRTLAIRNEPLIAAIPKTAAGTPHSFRKTEDSPLGVYHPTIEGGSSNPQNTVAGNLKLSYNAALGSFESGTQQILVRLLTDIDSPNIQNISNIESVDSIPITEFYDVDSPYYLGNFTTGSGVVLNSEKGNPHMYGPNAIAGCDDKKEIVNTVNRMPYSYSKNDIVLCALIGNEWLITTPGTKSGTRNKVNIKKWSFSKYIMDADSFCREYETGKTIGYDEFERYARLNFYESQRLSNNLTVINQYLKSQDSTKPHDYFDNSDVSRATGVTHTIPSFTLGRVVQIDNFFQVDRTKGGTTVQKTHIGRTNYEQQSLTPSEKGGIPYQWELPLFWGCVFSDGYVAGSKEKLGSWTGSMNKAKYLLYNALNAGSGYIKNVNVNSAQFINFSSIGSANNILSNDSIILDSGRRLFSDANDRKLYHLPAEIAINGPLDSLTGFPNENGSLLPYVYDSGIGNYLVSNDRYYYISNSGTTPIYNLKSSNPAKLQFSPLQLEYATYTFFNPSVSNMTQADKDKLIGIGQSLAGSVDYTSFSKFLPPSGTRFAYDTVYNAEGPVGGPELYPNSDDTDRREKSNVVGLITAVNTFSASDSIGFSVDNRIGLPQSARVTGGEAASFSFFPIGVVGVAFSTPGSAGYTVRRPRWGAVFDNYNSFGTTGLYVRIFDAWPREQTIYDPRYYGILHFNPGIVGDTQLMPGGKMSTPVDFTEPTASGETTSISVDTIIGSGYRLLPTSEWKVNTIRRGQLLTGGGFRYWRKYVGVSDSYTVVNMPSGLNVGEVVKLSNNVEIKILVNTPGPASPFSIEIVNRGQGFVPVAFGAKQVVVHNGISTEYRGVSMSFGNGGRVIFHTGMVYQKIQYDAGPKEHTDGPTRLSLSSQRGAAGNGQGVAAGFSTTSVSLETNPTKTYDAFYWFHNDILHTSINASPGYAQYLTLTIGQS